MTDISAQSRFILEEHRQLKGAAGDLQRLVANSAQVEARANLREWLPAVAQALADFHQSCRRHFEAEESSGFMEHLAHQSDVASGVFDQLRAEHCDMLTEMEALVTLSQSASPSARFDPASLTSRAAAVLAVFERHEQEENELLAQLVREEFRPS